MHTTQTHPHHTKPKHVTSLIASFLAAALLSGCGAGGNAASSSAAGRESAATAAGSTFTSAAGAQPSEDAASSANAAAAAAPSQMDTVNSGLSANRTGSWNGSTTYEVFVYSFCDSDGDGIGDLKGLTDKLDYINDGDDSTDTDLGASAIWLMPICPSPTYHKYDVTDYEDVDPEYGTLSDYDALVAACHKRGIKVINDLVMNHTSTEHPWFRAAADYLKSLPEGASPDASACPYVDYYNFSNTAQDGYTPLEGTNWYYEARFWSGMPDLNLDNENVRNAFTDVVSFWLDHGTDGFRLDACTSYYTENDAKNIEYLTWFNGMVREKKSDAYLVGECWTTQDTYASYYASGVDSFFDFEYAGPEGDLAMLVKGSSSASKLADGQRDELEKYKSCNANAINAPFYTNHDMSRSAGYYTGKFAESRVKTAEGLNLLMSGNAFLYYGEELGMKGSGKDENKRAPMYWSSAKDADGMCAGPKDMDEITMTYPSEEDQTDDPYSILSYVRQAIKIRNAFPAIAAGDVTPNDTLSDKEVCVYTKSLDGAQTVEIAVNLGGEERTIDLSGSGNFNTLSAVLVTSEDEIRLDGTALTLPPYGIAVLTEA